MALSDLYEQQKFRLAGDIDSFRHYAFRHWFLRGWRGVLLTWLIVVDLLAILTDIVVTLIKRSALEANLETLRLLRLDSDDGLWAPYGYLKLAAIAALLFGIHRMARQRAYLLLGVVFAIAALDDALLLHERAGRFLVSVSGIDANGAQAVVGAAETVYFAAVALIVVTMTVVAVRISAGPQRPKVLLLAIFFLAIGFFAVVVNLAEAVLFDVSRMMSKAASLVDDGGELIVSSLALVLAASIWSEYRQQLRHRRARRLP